MLQTSHLKTAPSNKFEFRSDSGKLVYFAPESPLKEKSYSVVFPGFTGDALTHLNFLTASLRLGMGVLCVNPKWANSTRQMRKNTIALIEGMESLGLSQNPFFVRGVSFGCDLSIAWLNALSIQPLKISWITPCSAKHLSYAASIMKIDVIHDDVNFKFKTHAPVLIKTLSTDLIVPEMDSVFTEASQNMKIETIFDADHFEAGNTQAASSEIAEWFLEE